MKNIVFIEGVSGVGKTTTTQLLHDKLLDMGYNVGRYLEGDHDNPFDPFRGTYPPKIPLIVFSEAHLQCWQNFKENLFKKNFVHILDGSLFHHQINDLVREYDASDEVIVNHIQKLLDIINNLDTIVFYLSSSDVGKYLTQARINRKKSIPTEEKISFWVNRKRIELGVLGRLSIESHILNVDGGWGTIVEKMIEYITI